MSQPTLEQVHRAGVLARRNTKRFFKDAQALMAAKSYGHAYGMLVFAEEEAGKALIFHCFADGFLRNPEWLALATAKHEAKHATMAITVMMRLLLFVMFGLAPHESMLAKRKRWLKESVRPSPLQVIQSRLQKAAEDIPGAVNTIADMLEEFSDLGQLQARRENGFFVDFDDSGEPTGPHRFFKSQCGRQLQLVRARLAAADDVLGSTKLSLKHRRSSTKVDPEMREKIASFESFLFGKKGKNVILEWLSSDQPKQLAKHARNFAADELNVEKMRGVLSEILSRAPTASGTGGA
ncbi:MAG: AbiV family abortive infection protein [Burkholderiales bacterium]